MSMVTPRQIAKTVNLIADSGIESDQYQALLGSGRFTELLQEFMGQPTITPIKVPMDYTRTLVEMRDATHCYDGESFYKINDENFPVEAGQSGEREFFLVWFHREIVDNEDPAKSELLRELDKLGLKPEGPAELCAIGEHHPNLQCEFSIVARRQVWRSPNGIHYCPILDKYACSDERLLAPEFLHVKIGWRATCRFLASRKPTKRAKRK